MRRSPIVAVAAAAVSASAAAPAQAHHDPVCVPGSPGPVCVTGLSHVVTGSNLDAIPDQVCTTVGSPVCVTGLRALANDAYLAAGFWVFFPAYVAACHATSRPGCQLPAP